MAYTKTTWTNETSPALNSTNLNKIEQGIQDAHTTADAAAAGLGGKADTSHTHTLQDITDFAGGSGHTVQDEGTPVTARSNLNFVGSGVAVTDDAGNDASVVTVSAITQAEGDARYAALAHTHPGELEGVWKYDDNTSMTSPASGRLRTNASGAVNVTQVSVHNTTLEGLDMERFFTQLSVNDVIRFQQTDESNNYGSFRITSPVTVTGVYTIANVVFVDGGGVDILNNADLYVRIVYGTQGTTPLHPIATSGLYSDLSGTPTLGTAADNDETDFATAAQGALADTSVQQDGSGSITTITAITQSAHDALAPPDANTFYVITGP